MSVVNVSEKTKELLKELSSELNLDSMSKTAAFCIKQIHDKVFKTEV